MIHFSSVTAILRTKVNRLHHNRRGVAAVEFALFVPVISLILLSAIDFGRLASQRQDISTSLSAGIQYFMVGGTDPAKAVEAIESSWENMREDTQITADSVCFCQTKECSCIENCQDGSLPTRYNRVVATTSFDGILIDRVFVISDSIRVR